MLEGRRYPYEGSYRVIERTTTDAEGKFRFDAELDRNHRLRVVAPAQTLRIRACCRPTRCPAFELSFRAISPGVVRLYQRYTVPKHGAPERAHALLPRPRAAPTRASIRRTGELKRVRAGRYTSQVDGHAARRAGTAPSATRAASAPRPGSGMGDPRPELPEAARSQF